MERQLEIAELRLLRLRAARREIEKEIRVLRETKHRLQESIKDHIRMYQEVQNILRDSLDKIETM